MSTSLKLEVTYHKEGIMSKALLCLSLFLAGYLVGTVGPTVKAQVQGFNSDGSSYLYYPPAAPGAPGQWFGSNGQSGTIYNNTPTQQGSGFMNGLAQGFGRRGPC